MSKLRYLSAFTVCMMMERASFSGMVLFCLRKKSRSFPSQYSKTVQNEFVSISNTSNNLTIPAKKIFSVISLLPRSIVSAYVYVPNVYEYCILEEHV